ncbi:MAG: hypothetical protein U0X75_21805 [Acidobacteriota bacterium]
MKRALLLLMGLCALTGLTLLVRRTTSEPVSVQETITGDWTAKVRQTEKEPVLWLSLSRNREKKARWFQSSQDFPLREFSGLNPNANASVQFTLMREAGTIFFDGLFKDGKGVGDFRLRPMATMWARCATWAMTAWRRKSRS